MTCLCSQGLPAEMSVCLPMGVCSCPAATQLCVQVGLTIETLQEGSPSAVKCCVEGTGLCKTLAPAHHGPATLLLSGPYMDQSKHCSLCLAGTSIWAASPFKAKSLYAYTAITTAGLNVIASALQSAPSNGYIQLHVYGVGTELHCMCSSSKHCISAKLV